MSDANKTSRSDADDDMLTPEEGPVRIMAALINPLNPRVADPEDETVTLLNISPNSISLKGWRIQDQHDRSCNLPDIRLQAGGTTVVRLGGKAQLGNRGGTIGLLDPMNCKVHGVSYTKAQARREGWTIVF